MRSGLHALLDVRNTDADDPPTLVALDVLITGAGSNPSDQQLVRIIIQQSSPAKGTAVAHHGTHLLAIFDILCHVY